MTVRPDQYGLAGGALPSEALSVPAQPLSVVEQLRLVMRQALDADDLNAADEAATRLEQITGAVDQQIAE